MRKGKVSMSEFNTINSPIKHIRFIGNHLPRQCGISTFTTDLGQAIVSEYSETSCVALPINDHRWLWISAMYML